MSAPVEEPWNKGKETRSRWNQRAVNARRDIWTIEVRVCPLNCASRQIVAANSSLCLNALLLLFGNLPCNVLIMQDLHTPKLAYAHANVLSLFIFFLILFLAPHRL